MGEKDGEQTKHLDKSLFEFDDMRVACKRTHASSKQVPEHVPQTLSDPDSGLGR